ncbi:hypothetical protein CC2G_006038 [Coprinopsis cinerea AmutBmut pab1-1]|nr:hypothetical protein CC2G_006038 [Coprinopsis cinerea AmutBmut pab1-1]
MSSQEQDELPPVLTTSVHDVRYFAALLRGVHFANMATITITKRGLTVTVEEARTLLGTAFIFADVFDEYAYHSEAEQGRVRNDGENNETRRQCDEFDEDEEDNDNNAAFQVHLNILIECLNIFGTAGPVAAPITSSATNFKKWRRDEDEGDDNHEGGRRGGGDNRRLEAYLGGPEKRTSMRLSYPGNGYPLTLLIAEDASGPTTTCEITTYDPEPHLDLDFDNDRLVLKIILKSSWLRDALSELDPSCEKLTFIGNPPIEGTSGADGAGKRAQKKPRAPSAPLFRIQADGTFGSTEMDYPNDREVLETFECTQTVQFTYRFGHILKTLRALSSSTKTSLRIDEDGLLSLQFLMPSPKPKDAMDAFIEFRCLALDGS